MSPPVDFSTMSSTSSSVQEAAMFTIGATPTIVLRIQKAGENLFVAAFLIALLQAIVALAQYRTNPSGQLIEPPGLTVGIESPCTPVPKDWSLVKHPSLLVKEQRNQLSVNATDSSGPFAGIINRVNRWMFLLIPWASNWFAFILERNTHLFHLGFFMTLAQLFDIPNRFFAKVPEEEEYDESELPIPPKRLVVIGDSLAVGLGSINIFDPNKDNSVPFYRMENLKEGAGGEGPVFPRVLAHTLADHTQEPVQWRSAGVDGGDVQLIDEYCLGVIEEECAQGKPPDLVVIICGPNDLKAFVSNPLKSASPREFRKRLTNLITKIRTLSPNATVLLPSLPAQMFHRNSPLNIFPLSFFLDTVVGIWESQKKLVADKFPSRRVLYLGLSPSEIYDWYQASEHEHETLIAADGVHPNARCYAFWATNLGNKLMAAMSNRRDLSMNRRKKDGHGALE
jgi:lysophospholipase L1-like esterase